MEIYNSKKDILGIIFFASSILILGYMFLTPLNQLIIHIDEYFSLTLVTLPIHDILTVTTWDVHPPLYYLLGKIAAKFASMTGMDLLFSIRILSIIPYILILVISAVKIREDYGWLTAGLFTLSLGIMSEFFTHFLIARMYSWAILFILIAFLAFAEIIRTNDIKAWAVLSVFSALCAYTHHFAAISAACIYIILFAYIFKFKKDELKMWAISAAAAVILYIPWIPSLIIQVTQVHQSYWIPEVSGPTLMNSFGYYAYTSDAFFSGVAILILATLIYIYSKETEKGNISKEDRFLILSGIGVYVGTIVLSVILSVVVKPILMVRYLLPATAIMWLTISVIMTKIENRRMFMISGALVGLLLITGLATTISSNDTIYQDGLSQKAVLDNITQDPNSMVIIPSQNMIMYFLDYANKTDMYCLNVDHVLGENMNRLHKFYDFKTYNGNDIDSLIANNTGKNIYIISWNKPVLNTTTVELDKQVGVVFSKVKQSNSTSYNNTEEEYYE